MLEAYIEFRRCIGLSEDSKVYTLERDVNGTLNGPADATGMLFDMESTLRAVLSTMTEYDSLRIEFHVKEQPEALEVVTIHAQFAEDVHAKV